MGLSGLCRSTSTAALPAPSPRPAREVEQQAPHDGECAVEVRVLPRPKHRARKGGAVIEPERDSRESNKRQRRPARPGTNDQSNGTEHFRGDQHPGPEHREGQPFVFQRCGIGRERHELMKAGGQEQGCHEQAAHKQRQVLASTEHAQFSRSEARLWPTMQRAAPNLSHTHPSSIRPIGYEAVMGAKRQLPDCGPCFAASSLVLSWVLICFQGLWRVSQAVNLGRDRGPFSGDALRRRHIRRTREWPYGPCSGWPKPACPDFCKGLSSTSMARMCAAALP